MILNANCVNNLLLFLLRWSWVWCCQGEGRKRRGKN